jgi:hypothetical protein
MDSVLTVITVMLIEMTSHPKLHDCKHKQLFSFCDTLVFDKNKITPEDDPRLGIETSSKLKQERSSILSKEQNGQRQKQRGLVKL